jgi:eukaryotic-like serine/threonine-protein kinase
VSVAALVLLSLTGGIIATAWEAHVARHERARAERRFDDLRNLSESFLFQFHDMIKDLNGATEARQAVVAKAVEYLNILEKDSAGDTGLQLDLAEASLRLGDIQGNPYSSGKGDPTGALARYDQALSLAQSVLRADPRNASALRTQAHAWREQRGAGATGQEAGGSGRRTQGDRGISDSDGRLSVG